MSATILLGMIVGCGFPSASVKSSEKKLGRILDSVMSQPGFSEQSLQLIEPLYISSQPLDFKTQDKYYDFMCGYHHITTHNQDSALIYADSLIYLVNQQEDGEDILREKIMAHISAGDIYQSQNKYTQAYYQYYLAKMVDEDNTDRCAYSEYSYRLGMVLYKKNQFEEAATYFKSAFENSVACNNDFAIFYRRQEVLGNTGLSYTRLNNADSALYYYNQASKFLDSNEKSFPGQSHYFAVARAVLDGNTAQVYAKFDFERAKSLYKKSISGTRNPGEDVGFALDMQTSLAELYAANNKFDSSLMLQQEVAKGLDTIPDTNTRLRFNKLMWQIQDHKGNTAEAYRWLVLYNKLYDSLSIVNRSLNEADIISEIKRRESDYKIGVLTKQSTINNLYVAIACILLIAVTMILFTLLNNWKRSKRYAKSLESLNHKINSQNADLQAAYKDLEQKGKDKDRLLQIIAHDLRNPVAGLASMTYLLKEEYGNDKNLMKMLDVMETGCHDALELINNILITNTNSNGEGKYNEKMVNVTQVLTNCNMMMQGQAHQKKIHFRTITLGPDLIAVGDTAGLARVMNNLVSNAIKFTPPEKNIAVVASDAEDCIRIEVRDEGIGIPENLKEKIFTSDHDTRRQGTNGEISFGYGLSICKEIIEGYGGDIWLDSVVGEGTSFYIDLKKPQSGNGHMMTKGSN
ncbi:tetratricopeptide repeat-containing sensor histidine kinase [Danxiaibacter flavus]|uniref:histidine kinase n=1 Tax=Danxiaibacter flavus TaxID=3049108 RepID=A0ABV3ZFI4_9BACT|nr:tetratricopeptide repeat-containing sensor histidine kinase [Chitinophagaceae bacterium DXS]